MTVCSESRRYPGQRVLLVTNKRLIPKLQALGLPGNVEAASFGGIRGLNDWEGVRAAIIAGWTLPSSVVVERAVGGITGRALPATGYQRTDATRLLADGTRLLSEAWRHPDKLAEALRLACCEGELLPAIGRPRGGAPYRVRPGRHPGLERRPALCKTHTAFLPCSSKKSTLGVSTRPGAAMEDRKRSNYVVMKGPPVPAHSAPPPPHAHLYDPDRFKPPSEE